MKLFASFFLSVIMAVAWSVSVGHSEETPLGDLIVMSSASNVVGRVTPHYFSRSSSNGMDMVYFFGEGEVSREILKLPIIEIRPYIKMKLVTNVTKGDNHTGCPLYAPLFVNGQAMMMVNGNLSSYVNHPWHEGCYPYSAPTVRWVTTEVDIEIACDVLCGTNTTYSLGKFSKFVPMSTSTVYEKLESKWEPYSPPKSTTNGTYTNITVSGVLSVTNLFE